MSVGTTEANISELPISTGGGLRSLPTMVESGRSGSISGSEFGLFGLVARSVKLSLQRGKLPAWLGGSEHRQNLGPLASENGESLRIFPDDFRRLDVS